MGLTRAVVGVLAQNHHPHLLRRCKLKCPKTVLLGWQNQVIRFLMSQKAFQFDQISSFQAKFRVISPCIGNRLQNFCRQLMTPEPLVSKHDSCLVLAI